jgi:hypothetical protein
VAAVLLAIDGLHPEQGHDTLSVVRALVQKRVWCAEALLASATAEGQRLLAPARSGAEGLGTPGRRWMSEKPDALVRGIAAEFPGVPPRSGAKHCLREVAKPVLEADRHATVPRRRQVRGGRTSAREVCVTPPTPAPPERPEGQSEATPSEVRRADEAPQEVVLDDGAAVRGLLHDDPGGPLPPPGRRMAEALEEGQASLQRHLEAKKGGQRTRGSHGEHTTWREV